MAPKNVDLHNMLYGSLGAELVAYMQSIYDYGHT